MYTKVYGLYSKSLEQIVNVSELMGLDKIKQPIFFYGTRGSTPSLPKILNRNSDLDKVVAYVDLGDFESHVNLSEFYMQSVINTRYIRSDLREHLINCLKPDLSVTEIKKQNLNEILSNNTEKRLDMLAAKFSHLEAIIFSVKPHIGSSRDSVMAVLDVSVMLEDYYVHGMKMSHRGRKSFLTKCNGDILTAI